MRHTSIIVILIVVFTSCRKDDFIKGTPKVQVLDFNPVSAVDMPTGLLIEGYRSNHQGITRSEQVIMMVDDNGIRNWQWTTDEVYEALGIDTDESLVISSTLRITRIGGNPALVGNYMLYDQPVTYQDFLEKNDELMPMKLQGRLFVIELGPNGSIIDLFQEEIFNDTAHIFGTEFIVDAYEGRLAVMFNVPEKDFWGGSYYEPWGWVSDNFKTMIVEDSKITQAIEMPYLDSFGGIGQLPYEMLLDDQGLTIVTYDEWEWVTMISRYGNGGQLEWHQPLECYDNSTCPIDLDIHYMNLWEGEYSVRPGFTTSPVDLFHTGSGIAGSYTYTDFYTNGSSIGYFNISRDAQVTSSIKKRIRPVYLINYTDLNSSEACIGAGSLGTSSGQSDVPVVFILDSNGDISEVVVHDLDQGSKVIHAKELGNGEYLLLSKKYRSDVAVYQEALITRISIE